MLYKNNKKLTTVRIIAVSGVVMALYITLMFVSQWFAFGAYQIRIATALYSLSAIHPFLIIPLALSNFLSNTLMGGLGILDIVGGGLVGLLTSSLVYLIKKLNLNDWFIAVPIILVPGLAVPIWLSYLIHVPYTALATSLCIGQIIPGIVGVLLVKSLRNKI